MERKVKIFAGDKSAELGQKVVSIYQNKFNPEINLGSTQKGRPKGCIQDSNVFFIQSTFTPIDQMMEVLRFVSSAQKVAYKVNVIIPYFAFSPQTRYDDASDLVTFFSTSGADRIISMDLYADMCQKLSDIPVEQMYVAPLFAQHIKQLGLSNLIIVAPGEWASKRAGILKQEGVDAQIVVCDIYKHENKISDIVLRNHCHFRGKNVILLKEVLNTAETTVALANYFKEKGANKIFAMASHSMLSPDSMSKIHESCLETVIITDSIPLQTSLSPKVYQVSIAETIADKIHQLATTRTNGNLIEPFFLFRIEIRRRVFS